jgi:pSer/pThr/pTyr-binding forkhead associated (FHA) protein
MSPLALTLMKFGLLALLYLFVWRALRSVAAGLSRGSAAPSVAGAGASKPGRDRSARRKQPGMPTSVVVLTKDRRRVGTHRLEGDVDIGRGERCGIRLDDTYASQAHARLSARNGAWVAEDLGSTNGTFLNERRLESPSEVRAGDVLRIGTTTLELRA